MKSYKEEKISERIFVRTFDAVDSSKFEWHRDKEDRKIIVLSAGIGWKFQLDNCLPVNLDQGVIISIPKETFHRVIAGEGKLKIRLVKDFK